MVMSSSWSPLITSPSGLEFILVIEYIWVILLRTCQLIHTESHSYNTLSNVSIFVGGFTVADLDLPLWIRVGGRLTKVSNQSDQRLDQRDMDSQIVVVD
ncbi:hypothetical protein CK203_055826 [Vitis vinifera]|uniref:Uncharacterized protein n=1 Tax=Vitis vinifera TaxID=29760 RepID=A0A438H6K1_VITVI|nr:hypothetical protein CK203_055826 [Vitis vinifera]